MATTVLNDIPEKITAGDTIAWKKSFADYSAADGWILSYALTNAGAQITFSGSAAGSDHLIEVAAATSANWTAGEYGFQAYVTKGAERYQIDEGLVEIRADLAQQTAGYDYLPACFSQRDAIQAVIDERATESQTSIAVGGRQISEMSHAELFANLDTLKKQCEIWKRHNRRARGKATGARVKVAFND